MAPSRDVSSLLLASFRHGSALGRVLGKTMAETNGVSSVLKIRLQPWLFHPSLQARFSGKSMVASVVPSKHNHISVLEINSVALRSFLGYLDFPCVGRIHTIVRAVGGVFSLPYLINKVQHIPESLVGSGETADMVNWRAWLCLSNRSYLHCPLPMKPGVLWLVPHPGIWVAGVVGSFPSLLLIALLRVRSSSFSLEECLTAVTTSPPVPKQNSDRPVLTPHF